MIERWRSQGPAQHLPRDQQPNASAPLGQNVMTCAGSARSARKVLVMAVVVALLGVVGATVREATLPQPASAQSVTRSFGSQPLNDVIAAASANVVGRAGCPLTADRLAAMMMAPIYSETGAINSRSFTPGPMTLSRWDNQAALYAFGDRATQFPKAFWHPGVGMWQFDSAGFWNLTTAQAISSNNSANMAAKVLADRFCASTAATTMDRMRFAWAPWYACATGASVCISIFNELFVNNTFTNVVRDPAVGRLGGMMERRCRIGGSTEVPCHRVDPVAAQGYAAWAIPGFGPTPVTAPFYNYVIGDIEYRYWSAADTGYAVNVVASKRITANARTGLTWLPSASTPSLCDVTVGFGDCGTPRVASTPWGNLTADPFGQVDTVTGGTNALRVAGWAIDPDTSDPIAIHVWVDGVFAGAIRANTNRPDVGAAVPGYGNNHGFALRLANVTAGERRVCIYAINVGPWGSTNPELACRTVRVLAAPIGNLDVVASPVPGQARVAGWTFDPDSPTAPIAVHVYANGSFAAAGSASLRRSDVDAAFPAAGPNHGFNVGFELPAGRHEVCVFAIDLPPGSVNPALGCQSVDVALPASPFGSLDVVSSPEPGRVRVQGWAIDPDVPVSPIAMHVFANGVLVGSVSAALPRVDVGAAHPLAGPNHGFDVTVGVPGGRNEVCVFAINEGPTGVNTSVGCRTVELPTGNPFGVVDSVVSSGVGEVRVRGWVIDPDTTAPIGVHVYANGVFVGASSASVRRTDVAAVFPVYGPNHGFDVTVPVTGPPGEVCVFAINRGGGTTNPLLGCRQGF